MVKDVVLKSTFPHLAAAWLVANSDQQTGRWRPARSAHEKERLLMKCCIERQLTAEFGEENVVLTPRRSAEIHVYGGNIILVTTGDVSSFALVYPDSFQLSPHV